MTETRQDNRQEGGIQELAREVRRYLLLQKRYLALDAVDKLTRLLSAVAIATVCLMLGAMVLFFVLYAMAAWAGSLTGSTAAGFMIVAAVLLLLAAVFYSHRKAWVIQPMARLTARLFLDSEEEEEEVKP